MNTGKTEKHKNELIEGQQYLDDEINLMDYIKVIIKRKKIILGIFIVCVAAAVAVSFLMPKVYQSSASIMIIDQEPKDSLFTQKVLLKSNAVLERVVNRLNLTDSSGSRLSPNDISGKLDVKEVKKTNILQLKAKDSNPEIAKELANAWADEYIKYSQKLISGEAKSSGDFLASQFETSRQNLTQAEKAVKDFDVKENLSLMKIELQKKRSKLESSYTNIYKIEFQLIEKKELLQEINEDIAAMTKDSVWLGSFNIKSFPQTHFIEKGLSTSQRSLRRKILKVKLNLEEAEGKRNNFINNSKIELLRQEVVHLRKDLLNDKSVLAEVTQLSKTTEANLESKGSLDRLKNMQGPISQNLPDSTVWEILSLGEKYNFFKTRQQFLKSKVKQEGAELKTLEKTLFDYETKLETLNEGLNRAKANYGFYLEKFKSLENAKDSTELEIADMKFQLFRLKKLVKKTETEVRGLKKEINQKESKLTRLNRQAYIYKKTYDNLSAEIENGRVTRLAVLGNAKEISPAVVPKSPVKPNKRTIVLLSAVLGLMLGVFIAFFMEFWQKEQ